MCYDGVPHASLLPYESLRDRLILLDGWSKTYAMTGWRLGWGVWPETLAPVATRLAINIHSCVGAATQWAGIEALRGPQDSVERMVAELDRRRDVIVGELNRIPGFRCVRPGGAFYAFPNVEGTGKGSRQLQDELLERAGVAVISGTSFGINGEGYLRFSYAASTDVILEACERIRRYLG
jgi:aspartate/methionine/tyrosine aminotransferase